MRKLTLGPLCLLCFAFPLFAQGGDAPRAKETVAVYIAGKETKESQGMHSVLGGELVRAISMSSGYSAVDRTAQALALLESEHIYQRGGAVMDEDVAALGKQLAARYLCIAEAKPVRGGAYYLNVRLIDVETAAAVAAVTETSALEDIGEMRRVARLLAHKLVGNEGEAAAAAAAHESKPVEPAPDPITARTRRAEAEAAAAAASALSSSDNTLINIGGAEETAQTGGDVHHPVASRKTESDCGDNGSGIRYGGRFAFSYSPVVGRISDFGGDWGELKSSGAFFSLGLAMSIPLTGMVSLNHELLLDVRSMELSVDDINNKVMEYALSLPLIARFEISRFYTEAGLRFDYPLLSDIGFADDNKRERIDMGGVAGGGFIFELSSFTCYLGYRFDGDVTDFDKKGYFKFYKHSIGLTLLF